MFILKLARLRLFLAKFNWKIQISIYIVNKLLFLIIFVEKFFKTLIQKKDKSTEKNMFILKIIKTPFISNIVYFKSSNIKIYSK